MLRSRGLMPQRHQTELSGTVWIGPDCLGPSERPSFCPTDLPHGIYDMCLGLAYVILFISSFWVITSLLYVQFHPTLMFYF